MRINFNFLSEYEYKCLPFFMYTTNTKLNKFLLRVEQPRDFKKFDKIRKVILSILIRVFLITVWLWPWNVSVGSV